VLRFVLDTNAAQLRIKPLHDIGRVGLGEEKEWQLKKVCIII